MERILYDGKGRAYRVPELWDKFRPRCSWNNGKTGFPSVNLLSGKADHEYDGALPAAVRKAIREEHGCAALCGTCPEDCEGCYAKMVTRNIIPGIKTALNTIEAKADPERFVWHVEKELFETSVAVPKVVRFHDLGEWFSRDYLETSCSMMKRHEVTTKFYGYTKANAVVEPYIGSLPDNFTQNCSPWEGHCDPIGDLPQFIYDCGDNPALRDLPHCPAVDSNGKRTGITCSQCGACARAKRGTRRAVYAHDPKGRKILVSNMKKIKEGM